MNNPDYIKVVRLVEQRASLGEEFTSLDLCDDWLSWCGDLDTKAVKRIQHALSMASRRQEIIKVRSINNPNRKGGNMFVWRGTLLGDGGAFCPTCRQRLPEQKTKQFNRDGSGLTKWI